MDKLYLKHIDTKIFTSDNSFWFLFYFLYIDEKRIYIYIYILTEHNIMKITVKKIIRFYEVFILNIQCIQLSELNDIN